MIIRKRLTPDEISPPNIRVNPETGEVEQTFDGGATWTPNPDADPRQSPAARAPALTGDNAQCDAAAGMVGATRDAIELTVNSLSVGMGATSLLALLLNFMPGVGIVADIVLAVVAGAYVIGKTAIDVAMTSEVYDELLCILLENIDSDGQMSVTQYSAARDQVDADIGGVAALAIKLMWDGQGEVGLSNAGSLSGETGDCDECGVTCLEFLGGDDGAGDWVFVPVSGFDIGEYDAGNDWFVGTGYPHASPTSYSLAVFYTPPHDFVSASFVWESAGSGSTPALFNVYAMRGDDPGDYILLYTQELDNGENIVNIDVTMPSGYDQFYIDGQANGTGGGQFLHLTKLTLCWHT